MLTTNYLPGAPNWVDLGTPDIDDLAEHLVESGHRVARRILRHGRTAKL